MGRLYRFLTFRDPLWHAFCYGSQLPKFNTLRPTLARFLLCLYVRKKVVSLQQVKQLNTLSYE